jgi:hypothetical protein
VDNRFAPALVIELAVTLLRGNFGQAPHQVRAVNAGYGLEAETARPECERHPGRRLLCRPLIDGETARSNVMTLTRSPMNARLGNGVARRSIRMASTLFLCVGRSYPSPMVQPYIASLRNDCASIATGQVSQRWGAKIAHCGVVLRLPKPLPGCMVTSPQ